LADDSGFASLPYHLKPCVSLSDFRELVSALDGTTVKVTNSNVNGLSQLCEELVFRDLAAQLSQFRSSSDFKKDAEAQIAIPITEINHSGTFFADGFMFTSENAIFECSVGQAIALSAAVREQLSVDACARTFALNDVRAFASVRCLLSGDAVSMEPSRNGLGRQLCSPGLELALAGTDCFDLDSVDLSVFSVEALDDVLDRASFSIASEDALLERLLSLGDDYRPLLIRIEIRFLSALGLAILAERFAFLPECVCCSVLDGLLHRPPPPPPSRWNSAIVPNFPTLFEDFKERNFALLWRGSRDGFGARDFHSRCDGHANTLTVILDMRGNIFGGFTPVEWESVMFPGKSKADPSLKSFLFTLKNPHNVPARRFVLKPEKKNKAISCSSGRGPHFCDMAISHNCNSNTRSYTCKFGESYTNDTGLDRYTFFTGSEKFQVEEIEVFEISA
jgi:hypothetical protein